MKKTNIKGYVARDEDGSIHLFETGPERIAECAWAEYPGHTLGIRLPDNSFPEVTWEAEPVAVSVSVSLPGPPNPKLGVLFYLSVSYILFFIGFCLVWWVMSTPYDEILEELCKVGWVLGASIFILSIFGIMVAIRDDSDNQKK